MDKEYLISFRDKVKLMWDNGKIKNPVHLPGGNEDQLIDIFENIDKEDYVFCTHRNMYHALLHGIDPDTLITEIVKDKDSPTMGRSGSMCIISPKHNFYSSPIIGGNCAIAAGVAMSIKMSNKKNKVWCFVGDCVTETGHFYESVNYVSCLDLPCTFIIEDNNRATCTSNTDRMGGYDFPYGFNQIDHKNIIYYRYEPTTVHVGSGKYVAF